MVGQTRAGIIAQIGQLTTPKITEGRSVDLAGAMRNFVSGFNQGKEWKADKEKTELGNAYTQQLIEQHPEDADKINAMGWEAYSRMLDNNAQREQDRQWQLEDRQFQRDLLREKLNHEFALAKYKAGSAKNPQTNDNPEPDVTEDQSRKQAQDSINQLAGVAQRNNIGIFTDWRRSHGLTGAETEREYGRISSAVAGLAPRAISKLKKAGVSGINSLPEFMTYIGLPQNPTSAQIAGAIPMMAQIAGVENPLANQPTQAQKMKGLFGKSNGVQVGQQIGNFKVIGVE